MNSYTIELTEEAEIEADRIYLRYHQRSPDQAERWRAGFGKALASLSTLPNRCPIARDNSRFPDVTVRQLLFGSYRMIYHVVEPDWDETLGVVRVLRIFHTAQGESE